MQLELHLFEPVGDVFVVDAADEDGPLVRVFGADAGGPVAGVEGLGDGAVDCFGWRVSEGVLAGRRRGKGEEGGRTNRRDGILGRP